MKAEYFKEKVVRDQYGSSVRVIEIIDNTATVQMVSSVKAQSFVNNSKSVLKWLLNSKRDPTISPIIAPNMINKISAKIRDFFEILNFYLFCTRFCTRKFCFYLVFYCIVAY